MGDETSGSSGGSSDEGSSDGEDPTGSGADGTEVGSDGSSGPSSGESTANEHPDASSELTSMGSSEASSEGSTATSSSESTTETSSGESDGDTSSSESTGGLSGPLTLMPIGDSITAAGCWRAVLWRRLQEAGLSEIDFVGSVDTSNDCGSPPFDGDNEGHGGYLITQTADSELRGWFQANPPDLVLYHFGTNDVWNGIPTQEILAAHSRVLQLLREVQPSVVVLVSQIIPMDAGPTNCAACPDRIIDLNEALVGWAASESSAASPVLVVDQWTGFNAEADTTDGVHPYNESGAQKIADRYYDALGALLAPV